MAWERMGQLSFKVREGWERDWHARSEDRPRISGVAYLVQYRRGKYDMRLTGAASA